MAKQDEVYPYAVYAGNGAQATTGQSPRGPYESATPDHASSGTPYGGGGGRIMSYDQWASTPRSYGGGRSQGYEAFSKPIQRQSETMDPLMAMFLMWLSNQSGGR